MSTVNELIPAVITGVHEDEARAFTAIHDSVRIPMTGMSWARPYINENSMGPKPEAPPML